MGRVPLTGGLGAGGGGGLGGARMFCPFCLAGLAKETEGRHE